MIKAQPVTFTYIDDLDGSSGPDVTTHRFTIDVEMELSHANAEAIRKYIADTFSKGRVPGKKNTSAPRKATLAETRAFNTRVRAWADKQGRTVAKSGTPSKKLIADYMDATGDSR